MGERRLSEQYASAGSGHRWQPEWDGRDSLLERFETVRPYLAGRSVLDVGCASRFGRSDWLHGLIAGVAADAVGLDVADDAVDAIRESGFDIRLGDAQGFDLGQRFDCVFAGEIIEHLDDVGGFLQSVRRHLNQAGRLVITTPNAFYLMNFVYRMGGKARVNAQHTCWFCEDTLRQVLERNGFRLVEMRFIGHEARTTTRHVVSAVVRRLLPERLALDTLLAVATPV